MSDTHTVYFDRQWRDLKRRLDAANLARYRALEAVSAQQARVYHREADRQIDALLREAKP